jgi:hemoglobin
MSSRRTVFELAGGEETFFALVDRFYAGVQDDPILRPMYPEELSNAKRKLALFFIQYFGGPTTYSDERGHPRLRMRHLPFPIGKEARDAWVSHMRAALDETPMPGEVRAEMREYFDRVATFLINQTPGTLPVRAVN